MLECIHSDETCDFHIIHHGRIVMECKAPFPREDIPHEPYYEALLHHVPQLLCEMAIFNALELWLICCTCTSVTLIIVSFDNELWLRLLSVTINIYHCNKKTIPTRLHPSIKSLKHDIKYFVSIHCRFVLEVSTLSGHIGTPTVSSLGSPYAVSPHLHLVTSDLQILHKRLSVLVSECKLIFKETHACLRQPARKICTFMMNNKDQMHAEYIPNCAPIVCYEGKISAYQHITINI